MVRIDTDVLCNYCESVFEVSRIMCGERRCFEALANYLEEFDIGDLFVNEAVICHSCKNTQITNNELMERIIELESKLDKLLP